MPRFGYGDEEIFYIIIKPKIMKRLTLSLLAILMVVSTAFSPSINESLYPELEQSFKSLKKNLSSISYDRRDELTGIQQMCILNKQQKKTVVVELISNDGFSAQFAKAVLSAALA